MHRLTRALLTVLFALAALLGASPARAQEIGELPASAEHAAPPRVEGPSPVLPGDVPVVVSAAHASIPPIPSSYTTRDLGWLRISFPTSAAERVAPILHDADAFKTELLSAFGQPVLDHVEVRVTPTVADMASLAPAGNPPPTYASGVAYPPLHYVLISMLQPRGAEAVDVDETFRHEMVHLALEDATRGQHVPAWFNEGLAVGLSGEKPIDREQTLWSATLSGTLIPFSELDRSFPRDHFTVSIAYAESADFTRFLMARADRARFVSLIGRVRDGQPFDRAITDAYGSDMRKLEFQWRSEAERRYTIFPVLAGGGVVWVVVVGALVAAYVKRRRRAKAILARWEREEKIEDAILARRAAEAAVAGEAEPLTPASVHARTSVKVEHDGGWHTLH